jgi:hypothetical protein
MNQSWWCHEKTEANMSDDSDIWLLRALPAAKDYPQIPEALANEIINALSNTYKPLETLISNRYLKLPSDPSDLKHDARAIWESLKDCIVAVMKNPITEKSDFVTKLVNFFAESIKETETEVQNRRRSSNKDVAERSKQHDIRILAANRAETMIVLEIFGDKIGVAAQMREALRSVPSINTHSPSPS